MTRPVFITGVFGCLIGCRTVDDGLHRNNLRCGVTGPAAIAHNEAEGRDGKCHKH